MEILVPRCKDAINLVECLEPDNSVFVIIGTSFYTGISKELHLAAIISSLEIIINDDTATKVLKLCKVLKE